MGASSQVLSMALSILIFSGVSWASRPLDEQYSFRSMTGWVLAAKDEPLYSEETLKGVASAFQDASRFEYKPLQDLKIDPSHILKDVPFLSEARPVELERIRSFAAALSEHKIHGLVLAEIKNVSGNYYLILALINARTLELVHKISKEISNPRRLESFSHVARHGTLELLSSIPFIATVVSREGYRVIIDVGAPEIRRGMQFATHTIERGDGEVVFTETGTVVITRAEKTLSFGKVVSDRHPLTVGMGNKLRGTGEAIFADGVHILDAQPERSIATREITEGQMARGAFGLVSADFSGNVISFTNTPTDDSGAVSGSSFFPGGKLLLEVFATGRVFVDLGFGFSVSRITPSGSENSLSSSADEIRVLGGYRLLGVVDTPGPTLDVQAGIVSRGYRIDFLSQAPSFTSAAYNGLLIGSRAKYPMDENWGVGFNVTAWLFSSINESPLTSGASTQSVSGWDVSIDAYHKYSHSIDIQFKLLFQNNAADFTGQGSREKAYFTVSQTSRAALLGLSYYF